MGDGDQGIEGAGTFGSFNANPLEALCLFHGPDYRFHKFLNLFV